METRFHISGPLIYLIELDFEPHVESPAPVFHAVGSLIGALEAFNGSLLLSLGIEAASTIALEEVRAGSLYTVLRDIVEGLPDSGLEHMDLRRIIGRYLVKGKYAALRWLDRRIESGSGDLNDLRGSLASMAAETGALAIPAYPPIPRRRLIDDLARIDDATRSLNPRDRGRFVCEDGTADLHPGVALDVENIEASLIARRTRTEGESILKVKKADFLGDSMWDFRFESRTITAKIADEEWLKKFRARKEPLAPGDALHVRLITEVSYDEDGEVLAEHSTVASVIEVIRQATGSQMLLESAREESGRAS